MRGRLWLNGEFHSGWLSWKGGKIVRVARGSPPRRLASSIEDLGNARIAPGFVDTLCHGFCGHSAPFATVEELLEMAHSLAKEGVTSVLSGFYPISNAQLRVARERWSKLRQHGRRSADSRGTARLEGWHLEGPFLGKEMAGALPQGELRRPTKRAVRDIFKAVGGYLRMMTLDPCLPGALELVVALQSQGCIPSFGHTQAGYSTCSQILARAGGSIGMTHLGNRMLPLQARELGPIGLAMEGKIPWVGVIPDGNHVCPETLKLWANTPRLMKQIMFQSDNLSHAGTPVKSFKAGGLLLSRKGSAAKRPDGGLGGTMDALPRLLFARLKDGSLNWAQIIQGGCIRPGEMFGNRGVFLKGKLADLVALGPTGKILSTWVGGVKTS